MNMGFLDNNSRFGRLMTRLGVLVGANLCFIFSCLPIVTADAGWAALHHTMLRTLRGDGEINPLREFVKGFRSNFKQATIAFLALVALFVLLALEIFWCTQFTGFVAYFRYGLMAILFVTTFTGAYLFPVMAAFDAPLKKLVMHALYFIMKRPLNALIIVALHVVPVYLTIMMIQLLPLFGFIWVMIGASAIVMATDSMLLPLFIPHLPKVDLCGEIIPEGMEGEFPTEEEPMQTDTKTLEDMRKLGM